MFGRKHSKEWRTHPNCLTNGDGSLQQRMPASRLLDRTPVVSVNCPAAVFRTASWPSVAVTCLSPTRCFASLSHLMSLQCVFYSSLFGHVGFKTTVEKPPTFVFELSVDGGVCQGNKTPHANKPAGITRRFTIIWPSSAPLEC